MLLAACSLFFILIVPGALIIPAQDLDKVAYDAIEEYLANGKNLYRQDKFQEAVDAWHKALELDPDNVRAQRYIERARERLKESEPLTTLEKTIEAEAPELIPYEIISEPTQFTITAPELIPTEKEEIKALSL